MKTTTTINRPKSIIFIKSYVGILCDVDEFPQPLLLHDINAHHVHMTKHGRRVSVTVFYFCMYNKYYISTYIEIFGNSTDLRMTSCSQYSSSIL